MAGSKLPGEEGERSRVVDYRRRDIPEPGEVDPEALAVFRKFANTPHVVHDSDGSSDDFHGAMQRRFRNSILLASGSFALFLAALSAGVHVYRSDKGGEVGGIVSQDDYFDAVPLSVQLTNVAVDVSVKAVKIPNAKNLPVAVTQVDLVSKQVRRATKAKIPDKKPVRPLGAVDENKPLTPEQIKILNAERDDVHAAEKVLFEAAEIERKDHERQKAIEEGRPTEDDWE